MKNLPSKAVLLALIKSSPSRRKRAHAVRLLSTAYAMTQHEIAMASGKSLGWVSAMLRWAGKARKTKSRHPAPSLENQWAWLLPYKHRAVVEGRTRYPKRRQMISDDTVVLKSGTGNWKIGGEILYGDWKGFPIYTLTLEERATCPRTCRHWRSCYGNKMRFAPRMRHGAELERRLEQEVASLADDHPRGFAVRLHILGDFYNVKYVELWRQLLERHPALHIWGYTARWHVENDPIAVALKALRKQHPHPGRFEMRFSNAPETMGVPSTISVETADEVPAGTILCPEQQEHKTESCSTCGLCWRSNARIAFRQH